MWHEAFTTQILCFRRKSGGSWEGDLKLTALLYAAYARVHLYGGCRVFGVRAKD